MKFSQSTYYIFLGLASVGDFGQKRLLTLSNYYVEACLAVLGSGATSPMSTTRSRLLQQLKPEQGLYIDRGDIIRINSSYSKFDPFFDARAPSRFVGIEEKISLQIS